MILSFFKISWTIWKRKKKFYNIIKKKFKPQEKYSGIRDKRVKKLQSEIDQIDQDIIANNLLEERIEALKNNLNASEFITEKAKIKKEIGELKERQKELIKLREKKSETIAMIEESNKFNNSIRSQFDYEIGQGETTNIASRQQKLENLNLNEWYLLPYNNSGKKLTFEELMGSPKNLSKISDTELRELTKIQIEKRYLQPYDVPINSVMEQVNDEDFERIMKLLDNNPSTQLSYTDSFKLRKKTTNTSKTKTIK